MGDMHIDRARFSGEVIAPDDIQQALERCYGGSLDGLFERYVYGR